MPAGATLCRCLAWCLEILPDMRQGHDVKPWPWTLKSKYSISRVWSRWLLPWWYRRRWSGDRVIQDRLSVVILRMPDLDTLQIARLAVLVGRIIRDIDLFTMVMLSLRTVLGAQPISLAIRSGFHLFLSRVWIKTRSSNVRCCPFLCSFVIECTWSIANSPFECWFGHLHSTRNIRCGLFCFKKVQLDYTINLLYFFQNSSTFAPSFKKCLSSSSQS